MLDDKHHFLSLGDGSAHGLDNTDIHILRHGSLHCSLFSRLGLYHHCTLLAMKSSFPVGLDLRYQKVYQHFLIIKVVTKMSIAFF